jgi:hypothetical protein
MSGASHSAMDGIKYFGSTLKMKTKPVQATLAATLLALGLLFTASASADVITCHDTDVVTVKTSDATAQGSGEAERIADDCAYFGAAGDPDDETSKVNSKWGEPDNEFFFVGKWDIETGLDEAVPGWQFSVFELDEAVTINDVTYYFGYELLALDLAWQGRTVDWVLGLKDGSGTGQGVGGEGGLVAYYWESITLDIEGKFRSFFQDADSYSHASGFVRGNGEPPVLIPEPSILALFGLGLLGMGWAMRRRRQT